MKALQAGVDAICDWSMTAAFFVGYMFCAAVDVLFTGRDTLGDISDD